MKLAERAGIGNTRPDRGSVRLDRAHERPRPGPEVQLARSADSLLPLDQDGNRRAAARRGGRRCRRARCVDATRFLRGLRGRDARVGRRRSCAPSPDHKPDCVVLDLHMPQMSGFEVQGATCMAIRPLPVVVMTGQESPESRARAYRLGASVYLCKPVDEGGAAGRDRQSHRRQVRFVPKQLGATSDLESRTAMNVDGKVSGSSTL